jgi:tetratricopeptide (TPR) repeat protein
MATMAFLRGLRLRWHLSRAEVALVRGKRDRAISLFAKALTLSDDLTRPVILNRLGVLHFKSDRFEEACRYYREAIAARPDRFEFHVNLANALERLQRTDEALAEYVRANELAPDNPGILLNLALFHATAQEFDQAVPLAVQAVESSRKRQGDGGPPVDALLTALVQICAAAKQPDIAEKAIDAYLATTPPNRIQVLNLKAILYSRSDRAADAIGIYEEILRTDPEFLEAHFNIGMAHIRTKNPGPALKAFETFAQASPNDVRAEFGLGYAHERLEHFELAAKHYEEFLRRARTQGDPLLSEFINQARGFLQSRGRLN